MSQNRLSRLIQPIALLLVGAGVVVSMGAAWLWLGKARHVTQQQTKLDRVLTERWAANAAGGSGAGADSAAVAAGRPGGVHPAPARRLAAAPSASVAPGTPIARLHLPTLGLVLVVVEGTGDAQLAQGPGRIAGTARLGEPGNVGVAAHRYPGVFWDLDRLAPGDPVVIETVDTWLVYKTVRTVIVEPKDRAVLGAPADGGSELTLVTCEPKLSAAHRLIKQAVLLRSDARTGADDDPKPAELAARTRL